MFFSLTAISRVLLSQDRHEIYVTIAEYARNYALYLQETVKYEEAGFLTMTSYGPFCTNVYSHMVWLGPVLRKLLPFAANFKVPSERLFRASELRTPSPSKEPAQEERMGRAPAQGERTVRQHTSEQSSPLAGKGELTKSSSSSETDLLLPQIGKLSFGNKRSDSQGPSRGAFDPKNPFGEPAPGSETDEQISRQNQRGKKKRGDRKERR